MNQVEQTRKELVYYGKKIVAKGLVVGPGGNISVRRGKVVYISASGYAFDEATEDVYVGVDIESGELVDGTKKPSSEVLMHLACYRKRPDIQAVVHTHPPLAIGVASSGQKLEPMFPDFVAFLEKVHTLDYIIPTTKELADAVEAVIGDYNGVLLCNHGALTVGNNLKEAYLRTEIIEESARILIAAKTIGKPRILSGSEVTAIKDLNSEKYRQELMKKGS
jgi:L-fuculose-phosphate aldolase